MTELAKYRLTASVVVQDENECILLVSEADQQVYGKLNLPGGHVDKGENVVTCAIRECVEETGLTPVLFGLLGVYTNKSGINIVFLGTTNETLTTPGEDILECNWLSPSDIANLADNQILHPRKLRSIVSEVQSGLSHPMDIIKVL